MLRGKRIPSERGSPSLVGRGIANPQEYLLALEDFAYYLKSQNKRNIKQIVSYAHRYHSILETGDVSPLMQIQSGAMRRHVMEALTALSKYQGRYDRWQEIRKCYSLRWTSGNESLEALQRVFNTDLTLDSIYQRIGEMLAKTPVQIANIIRFACITGLRSREVIESVALINHNKSLKAYYNEDRQTLEHFRFPEIFIRKTKKAFISFITPEMLQLARLNDNNTSRGAWSLSSYDAFRKRLNRLGVSMQLNLCRKLFASYLRLNGIASEFVDLLQGRVSTSILTRHYLVHDNSLRDNVLTAVQKLMEEKL